jgi:hypothetical protein
MDPARFFFQFLPLNPESHPIIIVMKSFLILLLLFVVTSAARAFVFTNSDDADAFVRSNAPTANYGAAGSLSVSGLLATNTLSGITNGIADTFIRFNTAGTVTNFNALFGTNNWTITGAKLQVTEVGSPNNNIFDQGVGAFQIYWVSDDDWVEGAGTPMLPASTGINYNSEPALLTNTVYLGTFTNTGANATLQFPLALAAEFTTDAQAGGEVTLFLTAADPLTGFTFYSRNFGTVSVRPYLEISALPQPAITGLNLSGSDVILTVSNCVAGENYNVLSTTDLTLPLNQWLPVASNTPALSGSFSITATNAAASTPSQYFTIEAQ